MPTFASAIAIHAEPLALFTLSQDYAHRLEWDPFLREARLLDGASAPGLGVRAWCVSRYGLGMETEYISYVPPAVAAVRMTRGPCVLARFAGSWRFTEIAPGLTRVVFRYHLAARPAWLRLLLDPLLMVVFARDTRRRLRALKRAAETAASPRATTSAETRDAEGVST